MRDGVARTTVSSSDPNRNRSPTTGMRPSARTIKPASGCERSSTQSGSCASKRAATSFAGIFASSTTAWRECPASTWRARRARRGCRPRAPRAGPRASRCRLCRRIHRRRRQSEIVRAASRTASRSRAWSRARAAPVEGAPCARRRRGSTSNTCTMPTISSSEPRTLALGCTPTARSPRPSRAATMRYRPRRQPCAASSPRAARARRTARHR